MTPHTMIVLMINIGLIVLAYSWIYPRYAGNNVARMMQIDVGLTGLAVLAAGLLYFGRGLEFSLFGLNMNWFFFSFVTYFLIELPLFFWYVQRNGMWSSIQPAAQSTQAVRKELADTRWDAVRTPERQRLAALAATANLVATPLLFLFVHGAAGLLSVVFGVICLFLLQRSVRLVADAPDTALDERQLAMRNRSYHRAYQVLSMLTATAGLILIGWVVTQDFAAEESLQSYVLNVTWEAISAFYFTAILLPTMLPSLILAWYEGNRRRIA